jgi:hypothetical protein
MTDSPRRTLRRRKANPVALLGASLREYLLNRSTRERSAYHEETLKRQLMAVLEESGEPDGEEGEHRKLMLEEVEDFTTYSGGKAVTKHIAGIQRRTRKGSMSLNEERTLALLRKRKLLDTCTVQVTVINEDAVLAANFEGTITDKELDALYDHGDPTYAFHLIEE